MPQKAWKPEKLNRELVLRVHAWIEEWHSKPSVRSSRGSVPADRVIAQLAEVGLKTSRQWLRIGEECRERDILAGEGPGFAWQLADLADEIRRLQTQDIGSTLYGIATDSDHKQVIQAAQLLLPRLDPSLWGPQSEAVRVDVHTHESQDVHTIPQETFDALTDDEREELLSLQEQVAKGMERIDALLSTAAERVPSER